MTRAAHTAPGAAAIVQVLLDRLGPDRGPSGPWDLSTRASYDEFPGGRQVDATRYGDWEYGGRCTDF